MTQVSYDELRSTFSRGPAYKYIRQTDNFPTIESLLDEPDDKVMVKVKLFNPTGVGTWYIAAYDPQTKVAWGVVEIHTLEVGEFYMPELVEYRGRFNLPIERDLHWKPNSLADVMEGK